jgi:hypothetical protein
VRMLPSIRALLRAFDNISPPEARQKAITPKLLRRLWRFSADSTRADLYDHAVDLVIGAFFFAMRPCEFVKTPSRGRTRIARLRCLTFRDQRKKVIPHTDPRLTERAEYVTVVFEDQKNKTKNDARTQRRTGDPILCPVLRFGRAAQRVITTVPGSDGNTPLCSLQSSTGRTTFVNSTFTRNLLRYTCQIYGGKPTFGFSPNEIGNRSLRSGAAMSLFLKNHSTAKIMILGRWSSDAFLVYIRPQVLEWTNNMSKDMIDFNSFLDVGFFDVAAPSDPRTRAKTSNLNGRTPSRLMMPSFNIN